LTSEGHGTVGDRGGALDGIQSARTSRVDHATAALRDAILDGRLPPGRRISQAGIAETVGTSRVPVREALRRLETEGLVTLVPRSGAWVAKLSFEEYTELYTIREWVEPPALATSVPGLADEAIGELHGLVDGMESAVDSTAWLDLDRRFHLASYAGAPLPRLRRLIEGFWNSTQQYRRAHLQYLQSSRDLTLVHAEHRLLAAAVGRRDAEGAADVLRSHIRRTRLDLARSPELFDP
jgi:DNA-binding GntR family transcriptional regulator